MTTIAVCVGELERCDREVILAGKARRRGLWRFLESPRRWMRGHKCSDDFRMTSRRSRCRLKELQKLLTGSDGKSICRVANNIGMNMLIKMKSDCNSMRCGVRVIIW